MEVRTGYKQTEVGMIPEDWKASTIGENSKWMSGGTPQRSNVQYWWGTIPWISGSTLKDSEISTSDQFLTQEAVSAGSNMAPIDATLLLVRGSALHNEIRAGLVVAPVAFNQDVKALVPSQSVHPKYLTYFILGHEAEMLNLVSSAGNSAGVLDTALVKNFKFLKPQLSEQRAIATALSDVDALLAAQDKLIAKKRDIKQAAMQQLLTGKQRLPGFSGEWEVKRLGDICGRITTGKLDANAMVASGEYPFFTCAREHYFINEYAFDADALLVSGNGANVGYVHHYTGKFNAYQRTYVLTDFTAEIVYLRLFMDKNLQERLRTEVNAGNTPYITMDTLTDMSVALPRTREEQAAIATALSDMDTELAALEKQRDKNRALKQGMMQELLTGRIRLINLEHQDA